MDPATITRALSVRQPYAELILRGLKRFELRSFNTTIRERVWIYASQKDAGDQKAWDEVGTSAGGLVNGRIIGSVVITSSRERSNGQFEWALSDPKSNVPIGEVTNQAQPAFWKPQFTTQSTSQAPFTPPQEPFARPQTSRRIPVAGSSTRHGAPGPGDLVAYHNPDTMGYPVWGIRKVVASNRYYPGAVGHKLWIITGEERPRRYWLVGWMTVAGLHDVGHEDDGFKWAYRGSKGELARSRQDAVEITQLSWYQDLNRACANFASLQHLRDPKLIARLETTWGGRR